MKKQQQIIQSAFIIADALTIGIAWLASYYIRFHWEIIPVYRGVPPFILYAGLLLLVVPSWLIFFKFNDLYSLKRGESYIDDVIRIFQGGSLATMFLISLTFFYRGYTFSRAVILLFWMIGIFLCALDRLVLLNILKSLRRKGINIRKTLIVGAGPLAQIVGEKIRQFPGLGLRVEGFVDVGNGGERAPDILDDVLGGFDDLVEQVKDRKIDQIIVALPRDAHETLEKVLKVLENEVVDIKIVPDLLQFVALRTGMEDLDGIPIINLSDTPLSGWYGPVKRAADILFSSLGIVLTSPVLLLIAVIIKLTSRGPVFYKQERMGLDGSVFTMYKFRSMKVGAEEETGAVWAKKDDPRRTVIGSFLRSTSLDELPQLFNVLKGEMSFVGPRPERPYFVEQFRGKIPRYMLRHKVKCGLTGWAQVNGYRGNTSIEKRIEYDIFYIENWSLSFDIKIIWLTFWKGLISKHAY
jgi:Undecaprenyl-phosphate glucose phosphotransferase